MQAYIEQLQRHLKMRKYSPKTVQAYSRYIQEFLINAPSPLPPEKEIIFSYILQKNALAAQSVNVRIQAIKYFYTHILETPLPFAIPMAKRPGRLPSILSRAEISTILGVIKNPKHRLLIALAYGAGLRVSEVVHLRVKDIDFSEQLLFLKKTKGNKERRTILPAALCIELQRLLVGTTQDSHVFVSERGGGLTTRTAQAIFLEACKKAEICKAVTFHSLRHSFATHMLEDGVDIRFVQELLGHKHIRTTEQYTHVTNPMLRKIQSPLDRK
ncbi:MAG: integrase [Candidatus Magasanikbacteria bacterium CG10_big_fil_rev_8_21_14_0_10_43_6]|uniref:Integrase n=1 Tax=Candidatus Magasanikbacteria bacterium CG10_big_fil_rev_8_21_14_0_10_43_6 TaxID=1974650 RepID=A0A2M6W0T1_9BACT|nr:MAG: integrase [Candidatus Magasanikbacteria bacterium CG10_big_fil_rev_8_21_14_0_10_43_6]